jgi:pimeloyl-ACP methyl ester carboxylesterase
VIGCLHHRAPTASRERLLLVMLPGVGIEAGDFAEHGLVAALHRRGLAVDVVAARPALDLYLDGTFAAELQDTVVAPAQAAGYARIWFLGISLGGMGALLYASARAAPVEGVVLLAPFLGTQGTVAEVAAAGGLAAWSPEGSAATDAERRMLLWLQDFVANPPAAPAIYLGYGRDDRFARGHTLLADRLPRDRVVTVAGGHDWDTWATLWRTVLDAEPFAKCGSFGA